MRRFAQVDVFGDGDGYGNPVAVIIDGDGVSDADMQRFANWTNLAETTFLLAPTRPGADYRVRIFTPSQELPFAGHPTLGSAHAWLHATGEPTRDRLVQECEAGLIDVRRDGGRLAFAAPPLRRTGPLDDATLTGIASTLAIEPDEVVDHAWTDNGPGWATVLLSSAERVLSLVPRPDAPAHIGVVGLHSDGTPELRAFVVGATVIEDPVTGSLNAGVAQWLLGAGRLTAPYVARQGTALGRRGRVFVDRDRDATIWVAGATRTLMSGHAALDA